MGCVGVDVWRFRVLGPIFLVSWALLMMDGDVLVRICLLCWPESNVVALAALVGIARGLVSLSLVKL